MNLEQSENYNSQFNNTVNYLSENMTKTTDNYEKMEES